MSNKKTLDALKTVQIMQMHLAKILFMALAAFHCATSWSAPPDPEIKKNIDAAIAEQRKAYLKGEPLRSAKITELLYRMDFESLESLIDNFERKWQSDPSMEDRLHTWFYRIDGENYDLLDPLNSWVKQRPSYIAYTARGYYLSKRAYQQRGTRYAIDTPELNFELMALAAAQAKSDLIKAIELKPDFVPAYTELISLSKLSGGQKVNAFELISKISKIKPSCLVPRERYLETLQPRWGGSFEAMLQYADLAKADTRFNPMIWLLTGQVYYHKYQTRPGSEFQENIKDLTEALKYGESNFFREARGVAYWHAKNYPAAISDFNQCITNHPNGPHRCKEYLQTLTQPRKDAEGVPSKQ